MFCDLLKEEVDGHMSQFGADSYIVMKKEWAQRKGISPVVYYYRNSVIAHILKLWIRNLSDLYKINDNKLQENYKLQENLINALIPFYKQYKGHYYNKNKNDYSDEEILFYCEREGRYIPLVNGGEAYYLPKEDYMNDSLRNEKIKELEKYNLNFGIDDVVRIHVPQKEKDNFSNLLQHTFNISVGKALSMLR